MVKRRLNRSGISGRAQRVAKNYENPRVGQRLSGITAVAPQPINLVLAKRASQLKRRDRSFASAVKRRATAMARPGVLGRDARLRRAGQLKAKARANFVGGGGILPKTQKRMAATILRGWRKNRPARRAKARSRPSKGMAYGGGGAGPNFRRHERRIKAARTIGRFMWKRQYKRYQRLAAHQKIKKRPRAPTYGGKYRKRMAYGPTRRIGGNRVQYKMPPRA